MVVFMCEDVRLFSSVNTYSYARARRFIRQGWTGKGEGRRGGTRVAYVLGPRQKPL